MTEEIKQCDAGVCPSVAEEKPSEVIDKPYKQGAFVKNDPRICANPPGRKKDTIQQIIEKKALKQLVAEYKRDLADALPRISPVLIKKAERGDLGAIKEINEVLIDKAKQRGGGGDIINNLILVKFIDGKEGDNN